MALTTGRCLLGDYLESKGWSQRYLSRITDVPKSNISDYSRNRYVMSLAHGKNIADALGCSIEDLYEWVNAESNGTG